ncbi:OmpA family protein [Flavobacterium sp. TSSA_36]|uniref:OmpA family protein n=1 Tax=Flavobacterium sp. TSSA_36 TaxID=3447669 RepID=UPI003F314785
MKHLNKFLVAVLMATGLSSQAQDSNNPWAITIGVNAIDSRPSVKQDHVNWFPQHFSQPFAVKDNWNILPSVSYIQVSRHINGGFSFGLSGSVNKIDKFVSFAPTAAGADSRGMVVTNPGDLMYYGIDGTVKYSFMELIGTKWFDPSLQAGGGYTFLGKDSFGTVNVGLGLTLWFTENVGLALSSTYRKSFGDRNDGLNPESPSLAQHTAGLVFKFGGKDTDGDGIYDKDDACPDVAGLKQFNGCPDTDGDGIVDGSDACPDVAGLAAFNGCPDTDGDGIADKDDACPDVAGPASTKGCPDTDGDGVADKDDKCPTVAGPRENQGCPVVLDADKDGVPDLEDACPLVAGPASNKGCPEVTQEVVEKLRVESRSIFFVTGKSTLDAAKPQTATSLDAIKEILKNYPNAKFEVNGHTDNVGKPAMNKKLSEARAKAVVEALVARGINPANLTAQGFGDTKPVASNKTAKGKAENRRTEVIYVGGVDGMKVNMK